MAYCIEKPLLTASLLLLIFEKMLHSFSRLPWHEAIGSHGRDLAMAEHHAERLEARGPAPSESPGDAPKVKPKGEKRGVFGGYAGSNFFGR